MCAFVAVHVTSFFHSLRSRSRNGSLGICPFKAKTFSSRHREREFRGANGANRAPGISGLSWPCVFGISGVSSGVTWVGDLWRDVTRLGSAIFPDMIEIAPLDGLSRLLTRAPGWLKR